LLVNLQKSLPFLQRQFTPELYQNDIKHRIRNRASMSKVAIWSREQCNICNIDQVRSNSLLFNITTPMDKLSISSPYIAASLIVANNYW
jgi:hypothetical protein